MLYFREWRLHAKLNQYEVAERMGISPAAVSRIESGKRDYNGKYLIAFAKVCGCHPCDPVFRPPNIVRLGKLDWEIPPEQQEEFCRRVAEIISILKRDWR